MNQLEQTYPFSPLPLPYSADSLSPTISETTLFFHHEKHLNSYVNNLNHILSEAIDYQGWTLYELIYYNHLLPKEIATPVRNNAGGVYNHNVYFSSMRPEKDCPRFGDNPISSDFYQKFTAAFGEYNEFKREMTDAASHVFGSGYVYLVKNRNKQLAIVTCSNQDTPLTRGYTPLLALDLWEHAYYLDYQNLRADYVREWFDLINWDRAEEAYLCDR